MKSKAVMGVKSPIAAMTLLRRTDSGTVAAGAGQEDRNGISARVWSFSFTRKERS